MSKAKPKTCDLPDCEEEADVERWVEFRIAGEAGSRARVCSTHFEELHTESTGSEEEAEGIEDG